MLLASQTSSVLQKHMRKGHKNDLKVCVGNSAGGSFRVDRGQRLVGYDVTAWRSLWT